MILINVYYLPSKDIINCINETEYYVEKCKMLITGDRNAKSNLWRRSNTG